MSESRDAAAHLLDHYISLVMEKAGLKPCADTHAEVGAIVDHLIDAACDEMDSRLKLRLQAHTNFVNASKRVGRKKP